MNTKKPPKTPIMKGYTLKDMETRIVKTFLDIFILTELHNQTNISGYDVTAFVNSKFGGILSPGTVYAALYTLERKGLIEGESDGRKTIYQLSDAGKTITSEMIKAFSKQMTEFIRTFLPV